MSSARFGRHQQLPKAKKTVRSKGTAPTKKEWVSTVNDLSVHKPTPAELNHKHDMMKSHNKAAAQWELREKALKRRLRRGNPSPLDETSLSIVREVLSEQMLLQDVLARSDRAMSAAKDIFGDAPRRQSGHPSVTKAPNCQNSVLPVFQRPDPPTELYLLSQSIMDSQALNEVECSDEDVGDENDFSGSKFNVLRRVNISKMKSRSADKVLRKQNANSVPTTPSAAGRAPDPAALNATVAVQRVRRSHKQAEEPQSNEEVDCELLNLEHHSGHSGNTSCSMRKTKKCVDRSSELVGSSFTSLSGDQTSLGHLLSMLDQIEAELDCFSPNSIPISDQSHPHRSKGLTGFSVALVSTVGRVVHLLKQSNVEHKNAAFERRQFQEELKKQQRLIEALAAENTALRGEAAAFKQSVSEIEEKVDTVVLVLGGTDEPCVPVAGPHVTAAGFSRDVAERDNGQPRVSASVQLTAPSQGERSPQCPAMPAERQHSSENISTLARHASLLSTSSASLSSLSSKLSVEAMMAEIEHLSRQNELIKAQLNRAQNYASESGASSNSYLEGQRVSGRGEGSPQSAVEQRLSEGRNVKSAETSESEDRAETSPFNVSGVEQRLLELNRQSAAARTRLLEIIDQQKHNASTKPSPSASPAPPSALGSGTDGGGSSEESETQEPMLHNKPASSNELSPPQSLRGTASNKEMKNFPDGWFSLSSHLR